MRFINILGSTIVLLCNIFVSYHHSIQLFESGGFSGVYAHLGVIAAEATFVLGGLNIVISRFRGESPGAPAILGGMLGVGLVGWSNVSAGWSYGISGILLGLATPASLVVAEAMLSRMLIRVANQKVEKEAPIKAEEEKLETPTPKMEVAVGELEKGNPPEKLEPTPSSELELGKLEGAETGAGEKIGASNLVTNKLEHSELEKVKLEISNVDQKLDTSNSSGLEEREGRAATKEERLERIGGFRTGESSQAKGQVASSFSNMEGLENVEISNIGEEKLETQISEVKTGELEKLEMEDFPEKSPEKLEEQKLEAPELENSNYSNVKTGDEGLKASNSGLEKLEHSKAGLDKKLETSNLKAKRRGRRKKITVTKLELEKLLDSIPSSSMAEGSPMAVAVRILEKEKKLPGRPRVKIESGCNENTAKNVVNDLRDMILAIKAEAIDGSENNKVSMA